MTCTAIDLITTRNERPTALGGEASTVERRSVASGPRVKASLPLELGRYRLGPVLGSGGMARVHAAWDPARSRAIALKIVADEPGSARDALEREAWTLGRLRHPAIVRAHGFERADGFALLPLEVVEGPTLSAWLAKRPPPARVLRVLRGVAEAIAEVHRAGFVHGDIKPLNVIVGDDEQPCLIDFGLSRPLGRRLPESDGSTGDAWSALTDTSSLLGTPAYMAPEVFAGKATDARADQFAFCVLVYEALFGRRPFAGSSLVTLARAVLWDDPAPIPPTPELPRGVRWVLRRGLAREPEDRFETMDDLLAVFGPLPREPIEPGELWQRALGALAGLYRWTLE